MQCPAAGRRKRKGRVGRSWYVDETFIRVRGQWRYLYRAIDRDGALVDVMLSEHATWLPPDRQRR
jgi:putative transposase